MRFGALGAVPGRAWCVARVVPGQPDAAVLTYAALSEGAASLIAGALRDSAPESELEHEVNYLPRLRSHVPDTVRLADVRLVDD